MQRITKQFYCIFKLETSNKNYS